MAEKQTDSAIYNIRPFGVFIAGYYQEKADYSIHRPSGSQDWLLMYTLSGEGLIDAGKETVKCGKGDVAILLPGISHHYRTKQDHWDFIWTHFRPDPTCNTWLRLPQISDRFVFKHIAGEETQREIQDSLQRVVRHELHGRSSDLHRRLSDLALEESLIRIQQIFPEEQPIALDPRIADILRYLQMYPNAKISIPELAKKSCLSTSRLSHLFREQVGDTIINTLCNFRLEKAAQLLLSTTRLISEIASDVGFDCVVHFTRKFREKFGETPSAFRKRKKKILDQY